MKKPFIINLNENFDWINQESLVEKKDYIKEFKDITDSIISDNGNQTVLDALKIMREHFTQNKFDIFLSHAHKDEKYALKIAHYFEKKGKKVFIDSLYWDYIDDLLKKLDDKFCYMKNTETYNYHKRNKTTSLIHSILGTSLTMMIEKCDLFIFLESDNLIDKSINNILDFDNISATTSSWVYFELMTASLLYKIITNVSKSFRNANEDFHILFEYDDLVRNFKRIKAQEEIEKEIN